MKMSLLITALVCLCTSGFAQEDKHSYLNRKTLTLGYSGITLRTAQLNEALNASGYPSLPGVLGVANVLVGSSFGHRWGGYYGVDLASLQGAESDTRSYKFRFNRFYGGVEVPVFRQRYFLLTGRLGISSTTLELRLYDTLPDTSALTNYLSGNADAKLLQAGFFSLDFGSTATFDVHRNLALGLRVGYILNPGSSNYRHDAGRFNNGPWVGLGAWYFGVQGGLYLNRRIIRISDETWYSEPKPKRRKADLRSDKIYTRLQLEQPARLFSSRDRNPVHENVFTPKCLVGCSLPGI